jgi:hypothetical protein
VILHAEERQILVAHAFVGSVVQIDVRDFDIAGWQGLRIHAKTMVLRGDFHLAGEQILDRVIGAMVAEFQLEGLAPQGEAAELMAQADPENGDAAGELLNIFDSVSDGLGVTGTIGKKDAIGPQFEDVVRGSVCGNDGNLTVVIDEQAKNVLFDPIVISDDFEPVRIRAATCFTHLFGPRRGGQIDGSFLPIISLTASDPSGEFLSSHGRKLLGLEHQLVGRSAIGRNNAAQSTHFADVADKRSCVHVPKHGNLVTIQIELRGFRRTPIGRDLRELADHERFNVRPGRFLILKIGADVPDVRIRQAHDLPGIAGVGEDFLITGEAGVENDFAAPARDRAGSAAVKDAAVFEREDCRSVLNFRQWSLRTTSFFTRFGGR